MIKNRLAFFLFAALLLTGGLSLSAQTQTSSKDYASYPYWVDMMQDPHANFFEVQKAFYTYWENRPVHKGDGYKPFKRWEWYWQSRVNPDGSFPAPDHVYNEYNRYVQEHPVSDRMKTGQTAWQELGPKTRVDYGGYVGVGRINAIAFDPQDTATVYIGAPKGGLWITHDSGKTWVSYTDEMPTMGVSAILVNPDNPSQILIGTGDRDGGNSGGMGVFRSDDGGMTWIPFNNGMGNVTVNMFSRADGNPRIILAGTNSGIFKTADSGENWTKVSTDGGNYKDIKFRPGSETVAYATANGNFFRSEDGGDTWTKVPSSSGYPNGGRLVIGVTAANDSLVYLMGGTGEAYQGCFLSRDFGQTFAAQSTSPNILSGNYDASGTSTQAGYDLMIHVDQHNPDLLLIGGINIWKSADAGKTWTITSHWWGDRTNEVHADQHTFAWNPLNNRLYAGNDGGIYYTDNNGGSYTEISQGLGIGQLYKIGVSATDATKMTAGFQDNGSATWLGDHWVNSGGGDGMECAVDPFDARYSYTSLYYGSITRYIDNANGHGIAGKGTNGITEDGAWITPFLISYGDGNTMVIGYKNVWISRNVKTSGSVIWKKISDNLAGKNDQNMSILAQSPADFNLLYAARSDGRVFRTQNLMDSSVEWTDITSSLPVSGTPAALECHPYDPNIIYMATNRKIYKSVNKGGSWENISGSLPDISINTIAYDKSSNEGLYIGTDAGIYYKDASMEDWTLYGTDFPVSVGVNELEIYMDPRNRADSKLRAATYGRGAWEIGLAETSQILPPSMLTGTLTGTDVELSWIPPFYQQDIVGYRVYRNGTVLGTYNSQSYLDMNIEPDVTFTYQVSAVYSDGSESSLSNTAIVTLVSPIEIPYEQPFEKGTGGWIGKYNFEGWEWGTAETLQVTGREGHFFAANSAAAGQGVRVQDYLVSPKIDLTAFQGRTITLQFAYTMRRYRTYDKFSVNYRVAPDSAWVKLADMNPPSKQSWVWDTTQINLPEKALTKTMQIGFYYTNSNEFAWGAAVDDIGLFLNTTSSKEIANPVDLHVYPNPGDGHFTVEVPSGLNGDVTVRVVNMAGQTVYEDFIHDNPGSLLQKIDMSHEGKGIYYLSIRTGTAEWKQKLTIR